MRLLVITRHPPLPEWDGAGAYLFDLVAYLARQGVELEIAWSQPPGEWVRRSVVQVPRAVQAVASLQLPGALALGRWRWMNWGSWRARALHLLRGAPRRPAVIRGPAPSRAGPARWSALPSHGELRFFRERIAAFKPDVVLANYCWLLPALEHARVRIVVLAHDVVSQRLAPAAGSAPGHRPDPGHPDGERELLSHAQAILAITGDDAGVFRRWLPHGTVVVTPKAVTPCAGPRRPVPGRCLFVGGLNEPNRAGLAWLLAEIWPLVRQSHPDATLHVFGPIAATVASAPAGVTLRGRVGDLTAAYAESAVALVPLLAGTGLKIKLVEAAGHGVPCVTTPIGLQGLEALRNEVLIAASAGEFAASVGWLLADAATAARLGQRLQQRATQEFSPDRCYRPALAALFPDTAEPVPAAPVPAISVVLPVYNAERYLRAALTSILRQTWGDFELIAVNDGSTDDSGRMLDEFAQRDQRIVVCHRPNCGITGALNHGLALARGEFIARMDADDEAAPTRFAAQLTAMRADPQLVALGSAITFMDAAGHPVKAWPRPVDHPAIERALLSGDGGAMIHPAVMLRADAVRQVGGYRPVARHVEDLDLFLRLARIGRLGNLPGHELRYRVHPASVNFTRNAGRHEVKLAVLREAWAARGLAFDPAQFADCFARYADPAGHHLDWSVTSLAYGSRSVAVGHGWRTVLSRPFARSSWKALRYALTAPMPHIRPGLS